MIMIDTNNMMAAISMVLTSQARLHGARQMIRAQYCWHAASGLRCDENAVHIAVCARRRRKAAAVLAPQHACHIDVA
jgi:hypothetical protein